MRAPLTYFFLGATTIAWAIPAFADEPEGDALSPEDTAYVEAETPEIYDISVFGDAQSVARVAGPAHRIGKKELDRFEDDNVERTLPKIPGVYVRGEDGFGLRPNIGMRGANSDRSSKVNLLEDGVLFGPAPYSAPAAYYFPIQTRLTGVEVFKGASAIRHGPNTIGGTINFLSRPIPHRHELGLDLAAGSNFYGKAHGYYGYGADNWGVLIEGVRLRSDGFKELDSAGSRFGDDTGFDKMEFVGKARVNTNPTGSLYNEGNLKVSYSREISNETYLGLSDADFLENPVRRYAASARDRMRWDRTAFELSHGLVYQDEEAMRTVFSLRTTAYRHDFHRDWRKINGFGGSDAAPLSDILATPNAGRHPVFYDVLTGGDSTSSTPLDIGTNDRTFVSQGVQTAASWRLPNLSFVGNRLQLGARIHNDSIERLHTSEAYRMRGGVPETLGLPVVATVQNTGEATAFAGYVIDEIALGPVLISPGVRFELIDTQLEDALTGEVIDGVQRVVLPGVGAIYQPFDALGIYGGVNMGFSPLTPGQFGEPEVAVNYELGARLKTDWLGVEATRFISDYSNLSNVCTFSQGCADDEVDTQFDGREARITGIETAANVTIPTPIDLHIPITLTYTFTRSMFLSSFESSHPQWGRVTAGDTLPNVPAHQAGGTLGLLSDEWGGLNFSFIYTDGVKEAVDPSHPLSRVETDSFVVIDATAELKILPELAIYGKVENLLNNAYIVSRRPFGARPGRPRFVAAGVKVLIDR